MLIPSILAFMFIGAVYAEVATAQVNVPTYHNNVSCTGLSWQETVLAPSKVKREADIPSNSAPMKVA